MKDEWKSTSIILPHIILPLFLSRISKKTSNRIETMMIALLAQGSSLTWSLIR